MSKQHEFAMYQLDECLGTGTAKELAKKWNVLPEYIRYLSTPAHKRRMARTKRQPSKARYTIKLGVIE